MNIIADSKANFDELVDEYVDNMTTTEMDEVVSCVSFDNLIRTASQKTASAYNYEAIGRHVATLIRDYAERQVERKLEEQGL